MRQYGEEMKQVRKIRLREIYNSAKPIIRIENFAEDMMRGVVRFVDAFELQFGVRFMRASIKNIVDDSMASTRLATHS